MAKQTGERVTTGIKELDGMIEGGYKKHSINLLEGGPGAGKSIFAMQYLIEGIKKGEHGAYITFEEEKHNLIDNMSRFWDLKKYSKELYIEDMKPNEIEKVVQKKSFEFKFKIIKEIKAHRIVIDSITAYSLLFDEGMQRRESLLNLFKTIREMDCTALLISEREIDIDHNIKRDVVEFEVDSIIALYNIRKQNIRERALEVKKIRGTGHNQKIIPMKISDSGIKIFPEQTLF